ncbi:MAG: aldo/keto reductase [Deltaproteobacteria bacterium]|nr:aldo/keto reductase [Deltaproteobacteria bacterium]
MQKRQIGKSPLMVSPLTFGGNVFGWTIDETTSFSILDAFVDAGFEFIDTADVYSAWKTGNQGGESETILGAWMKARGNRSKLIIATKVGMELAPGKSGLAAPYIMRAVEDSLRRLRTDYIDLYQAHRDDPSTPLDETLEAFDSLVKQGKVRAIGASNYSPARLEEALSISEHRNLARFDCLQPEYNLYQREGYEKELEGLCVKHSVGVIPYYALASGFLSGKYRSERDLSQSTRGTKVSAYLNERGFRILAALDEVSKAHDCAPASIALAWLMQRSSITAPIASATSLSQLSELTRAAHLKLSADELILLNRASESAAS